MSDGEEEAVLTILHTADWHLGRTFPSFSDEHERTLSRARLDVLDRILHVAERRMVDAVLCAGDLFDEASPSSEWWEEVAKRFSKCAWKNRHVFLLPGNHDPLLDDSVWHASHKFRRLLPDWVHVVDREDFQFVFPSGAVLYAVPCMSTAGQLDPTEKIPPREPGDERIRIGMVHGSTFDMKDHQTNFPIAADAVLNRGLDYLAIGDTHGFRYVPHDRANPPTIYPGAPEPTAFDEREAGNVAVVLFTRQRKANVHRERVAAWTWEVCEVRDIASLRALRERTDLDRRVLRLTITMQVAAPEYEEAERIIQDLAGTSAKHNRVGVLDVDRSGLRLQTEGIDQHCKELPDVLQAAVRRLSAAAKDPAQREQAERALFLLYRESRKKAS